MCLYWIQRKLLSRQQRIAKERMRGSISSASDHHILNDYKSLSNKAFSKSKIYAQRQATSLMNGFQHTMHIVQHLSIFVHSIMCACVPPSSPQRSLLTSDLLCSRRFMVADGMATAAGYFTTVAVLFTFTLLKQAASYIWKATACKPWKKASTTKSNGHFGQHICCSHITCTFLKMRVQSWPKLDNTNHSHATFYKKPCFIKAS